jgi:hypothetical protein
MASFAHAIPSTAAACTETVVVQPSKSSHHEKQHDDDKRHNKQTPTNKTPTKHRRPARNTLERNPKPKNKKKNLPEMIKRRPLFQNGNNRKRVIFRDRERTTAMTPELLQERHHCYANPTFVLLSLPPSLPLSLRTPLEFFTLLARRCTPLAAGG